MKRHEKLFKHFDCYANFEHCVFTRLDLIFYK